MVRSFALTRAARSGRARRSRDVTVPRYETLSDES